MIRFFANLSLRWKLAFAVGALLLAVSVGQFWSAYLRVRDVTESAAIARMPSVIDAFDNSLQAMGRQLSNAASADGARPEVTRYFATTDSTAFRQVVSSIRSANPDSSLLAVNLIDITGRSLAIDVHTRAPLVLSADELVRAARSTTGVMGAMQDIDSMLVFPVVARVNADKHALGFLVEWHRINMNPNARARIGTLIGNSATVFVGSPGGGFTDQVSVVPAPPISARQMNQVLHYSRAGGGAMIAQARAISGTPWVVALEFPEDEVLAPAHRFLRDAAWMSLALFVVGIAVAAWLAGRLVRPLHDVTEAVDALAAGSQSARVIVRGQDESGRLALAFNRMAEWVDHEAAARLESESQWRRLFDANPQPMWLYEAQSLRIVAVNEAAVSHYGWTREEFVAMTIRDLRPPGEVALLDAHLKERSLSVVDTSTWRHQRKDGSIIDVETSSHTLMFDGMTCRLVLAVDVTERRVLEAQFRQSQKMEAIGRLAGGVAHDFNNILAVVTSLADLIRMDLPDEHRAATDLQTIVQAAQQGHRLTKQLLAFSRKQVLEPVVLNPNSAVTEAEQMLRRTIGEDIELSVRLATNIGSVLADPGQLHQVLLNLAVNARDAMPRGGRLMLATMRADVDEAARKLHGLPAVGSFAVLSVTDTGIGMTPEVRARVFEPFFTTKELGKGTGLGLATAYGIVTQSGGNITVYSEPGHGSTFRIYLPIVPTGETVVSPAATEPQRGGETILLVEDDPMVRGAATEVLSRLGYTLLVADHPHEAIRMLAARNGLRVDLVVSDVVMPRMDGPTLVDNLRREQPGLKAVLMSGYPGDAIREGGPGADAIFLEKPFTVAALARVVRETLDAVGT